MLSTEQLAILKKTYAVPSWIANRCTTVAEAIELLKLRETAFPGTTERTESNQPEKQKLARLFQNKHTDTSDLMTALDAAGIESDQDWENGTTTWTFEDGSKIRVDGPFVEVIE